MKAKLLIALFLTPLAAAIVGAGTLTVTNTNDNLAGSLRQAIQDANSGDTIAFAIPTTDPRYDTLTKTWTITLVSAELAINKDLTLDAGSARIIVQRSSAGGTPQFRIFNIVAGTVSMVNLTIANGSAAQGGGVQNAGTITLRGCTVRNNFASGVEGGGLFNVSGAVATMTNCTFYRDDLNAITNDGGTMVIENSTVTNNGGPAPGAGGIYSFNPSGMVRIRNSVIAGNDGSLLDVTGNFISEGYNFIGAGDRGTGFGNSGSHDQVGTAAAPANPQLGPLQNNGGNTFTVAPLPGSPLIDQGNSFGLAIDQRGFRRPTDQSSIGNAGDGSEIGAFELGIIQTGPSFTVNTTDEHSDGLCEDQDCTLWDAANAAGGDTSHNNTTVSFAPNVVGTITTALQADGIIASRSYTIVGPGARLLTISGARVSRVFHIESTGVLAISGLTIANGAIAGVGGGILNEGSLTLTNCTIANNTSDTGFTGGGIYSSDTLTLTNCTLQSNQAFLADGGGVNIEGGTAIITNCTFSGNLAISGGGLSSKAALTVRSSTFTGNSANGVSGFDSQPGFGGGILLKSGTADIANTLIANNNATFHHDLSIGGSGAEITLMADYDLIRDNTGWNPGAQGSHNVTNQEPQLDPAGLKNNGGTTDTIALLANSPGINAASDVIAPNKDQRGLARNGLSDIGAFEFAGLLPVSLGNISTRGVVGIGDEVMIGGFVINGTANKTVVLRAIGPSLGNPPFNLMGVLQDPSLFLFGSGGMITSNDNWADAANASSIDPALRPSDGRESAILIALSPGSYTAIVRGVNSGTGLGLVEVFDLDATVPSMLANISTRGLVETGDGVLIGGFIVKGPDSDKVVIRAIGPSLAGPPFNLTNVLQNPTLGLFNDQGQRIQFNDDWQTDQAAEIAATGLQPGNTAESAMVTTLMAGNYTAIVNGVNATTGLALVEVFGLN